MLQFTNCFIWTNMYICINIKSRSQEVSYKKWRPTVIGKLLCSTPCVSFLCVASFLLCIYTWRIDAREKDRSSFSYEKSCALISPVNNIPILVFSGSSQHRPDTQHATNGGGQGGDDQVEENWIWGISAITLSPQEVHCGAIGK